MAGTALSVLTTNAQNIVFDTETARFTAAEWTTAINDGARDIRHYLISNDDFSYWMVSASLASAVTPTTCDKVLDIYNDRTSVTAAVLGRWRTIGPSSTTAGATIEFLGGSATLTSATIKYLKQYTAMTQAADEPDLPDDMHYLCANLAAARYYMKGGTADAEQARQQLEFAGTRLGLRPEAILKDFGLSRGGA